MQGLRVTILIIAAIAIVTSHIGCHGDGIDREPGFAPYHLHDPHQ